MRVADEISFVRCQGDGKIRAAKIGGKRMIPNDLPAFREGTQATWNKMRWIAKDWPSGLTEVKSTAGNRDSAASFWPANFSGPWTWVALLLSPYPNFFTASGE